MSSPDGVSGTQLAPDEAFAVLGNETRMEILRTLGEADEPLSFSDLYDRVSTTDSGNFTYHLDKLVGHFVKNSDDTYALRRAGERIIEAIVSGAVTETPVIEPTRIEWPCGQCGAQIVVSYQEGWMGTSCPECSGNYGDELSTEDPLLDGQLEHGYLGGAPIPPAMLKDRDAREMVQAAHAWSFLEKIALSHGICPRCSASVDRTLTVCEDHEDGDGLCGTCDRRYREVITVECPNCPLDQAMPLPAAVHGYPVHVNLVTAHGFDPVVPTAEQWATMQDVCDWEVLATDPIEARITYSLEGHEVTLTVDENLDIVDVIETGTPSREGVKRDPTRL